MILASSIWVMTLFSTFAVGAPPVEQEFTKGYTDFSVHADPQATESAGPVLRAEVDLGGLKSGEKGVATIKIQNPFEHDIPIINARASCSCARSMLLGTTIPARGTAELLVAIAVPKQRASAEFIGTVSLGVDRAACKIPVLRDVIVTIRYNIEGMLCFVDRHASFAVRQDSERTILIPFVATIPGVPESVEIEGTGFISGVSGSLVQVNKKWFVEAKVSSEIAGPQGVVGELTLKAKKSQESDTISLVLFIEDMFQISPRTLRFRPSEDGFEANGILHISDPKTANRDRDAGTTQEEHEENGHAFCEAFLGNEKIDVETQRISKNVYRLKAVFKGSEEAMRSEMEATEGANKISWNVIDNEKRHLIETSFILNP